MFTALELREAHEQIDILGIYGKARRMGLQPPLAPKPTNIEDAGRPENPAIGIP